MVAQAGLVSGDRFPGGLGVQPSDRQPKGVAEGSRPVTEQRCGGSSSSWKGNRGAAGSAPASGRLQCSDSHLWAQPGPVQLDSNQLSL